jgi:OOP family OmpA-OmpF porin
MSAIGSNASPRHAQIDAPSAAQPQASDLAQVRALLLGADPVRLSALQRILDDPSEHTRFVASVLSEALAARSRQDDSVARALTTTIDRAIEFSVRRNPKPLADAVFPIIGPAIRKALAEALKQMLATLNYVLENQVSFRALKWRLEAHRSGKSYAEVVLLHSLAYQVEQVLLIHADTGLLLASALSDQTSDRDADVVSAMLTAIQDFIKDSFRPDGDNDYQSTQIGEFTLFVDRGPAATLAAVVRGAPPVDFRTTLHQTLESIHHLAGSELATFAGDTARFEFLKPHLSACLLKQEKAPNKGGLRMWRLWLIASLLLGGLIYAGFTRSQETRGFESMLERLDKEPGIVVVSAGKTGATYRIAGLRDPLSRPPEEVMAATQSKSLAVALDWKPYVSVEPELVLKRVKSLFAIPATVEVAFVDGVLTASGTAQQVWIHRFVDKAMFVPGVTALDARRLQAFEALRLKRDTEQLEKAEVLFDSAATELGREQSAALDALTEIFSRLVADAEALALTIRIVITGQADPTGSDAVNRRLSLARAEHVKAYLVAAGVPDHVLEIRGIGIAGARATIDDAETELARYRRVDFQVVVSGRGSQGGG